MNVLYAELSRRSEAFALLSTVEMAAPVSAVLVTAACVSTRSAFGRKKQQQQME